MGILAEEGGDDLATPPCTRAEVPLNTPHSRFASPFLLTFYRASRRKLLKCGLQFQNLDGISSACSPVLVLPAILGSALSYRYFYHLSLKLGTSSVSVYEKLIDFVN